jgi:sugar O-acyltransferase (sialic acid O-acetyltransferase NeuD family)
VRPLILAVADARTLPRLALDVCAAAGREVTGLLRLDQAAEDLRTHRPVQGGAALLEDVAFLEAHAVFVAVDGPQRRTLTEAILTRGGEIPALVHPSAVMSASARIGAGTLLSAGVIVQMDAVVGRCCSLHTAASVDHDNVHEDGVTLAPGVRLAGHVSVGEGAFIGLGAVVKGGTRIGRNAIVGAGAVVLRNVPDAATVVGNPARPLAPRG